MRDVISNETIKEINAVIDEILTNIDDNVRNIVGAGNYSLPTIFSYTNYSGQTVSVHGSTFRHEIIIDNADGNNLIGDICTVIGDRNGIKLAKAGVEDRHDTFANYWDSTIDIAYSLDNIINGYVFDMHNGYIGEGANSSSNMSFKIDGLEIGKSYTLTFTGRFARAEFVVAGDSYARICSDISATPYIASVTLEKDTVGHVYRLDFTNNTQSTTLYLNFDFLSLSYEESSYVSEFIAENLVIAGMNIGIISRYMYYNRKWYPIEAGGGTSDLDAIELTYAEYQALTPAEKTDPDKIYFITDYPSGSGVVINPTGTATDTAETIEVDGTIYDFMDADAVHTADIGVAGGVAELDANGKVPSSQLPSYVDDVVEYASISAFPATGESGKIYIALDTNKTYRWTGSVYVEISPSLALGETSSTAYRGDRGKIAYDHSQSDHSGIAPAFTEASTRANIASGETFATLLGKIKKFFSDLKAVAFSGSYNDLSDTPTIPAAQVNSDWNATSGKAQILNKPTIPTVNNATLTIQKNGTNVETFTANASSNKTANITVPTKVSELTNDSGYTTNTGTVTQVKVGSTAYDPSSGIVSLPAYPTNNFSGTTFYSGKSDTSEHNANNAIKNGHYYYNSNGPSTTLGASTADGALYVQSYSDSWVGQVAQDYHNGRLFVRGKNNGTWQNWLKVIDSGNIGSQSVNYATSAGSATSATSATKDGDGNTISSTYLKLSGGTLTGGLKIQSSSGLEVGKAGNSSTSSVGGNIWMYNVSGQKNAYNLKLHPATLTANRDIVFPNDSGTVALTYQIPSAPHTVREYTGTITGDVVRVTHNLGLGTSYKPIVSWTCSSAIVMYGMKNITTNYFEVMFASINGYVIGTATGISVTIRWTY